MERAATGIAGLDELLMGGIPRGAGVLISGGAGTGKSILSMQFLYNGAVKYNEPGIYITLEEGQTNMRWNMESFGWDLERLQEENLLRIYTLVPDSPENFVKRIDKELDGIASLAKGLGAKRLVLDSTTALGIWLKDPALIRYKLFDIINKLKSIGCTSLFTAETKGGVNDFSAFGVEEFVVDGVIAAYFKPPQRAIFVRKMRGTNHSKDIHPLEIGSDGITISARDRIMWDALR